MNKLFEKYLKLDQDSKHVLNSLSLFDKDISLFYFNSSISSAAINNKWASIKYEKTIDKLLKNNFILEAKSEADSTAIYTNPEIKELIAYQLSKDSKEFNSYFKVLNKKLYHLDDWKQSIYLNNINLQDQDLIANKSALIINNLLDLEFIEKLPVYLFKAYFNILIGKFDLKNEIITDNLYNFYVLTKKRKLYKECSEEVFCFLLFNDEIKELNNIIKQLSSEFQASYHFITDDFKTAEALFKKSFKTPHKNFKKNKSNLLNFSSIFYILLQIKNNLNNKQDFNLIKNYTEKEISKSKDCFYFNSLEILKFYIDYSISNTNTEILDFYSVNYNKEISIKKSSLFNYFIFVLIYKFIKEDIDSFCSNQNSIDISKHLNTKANSILRKFTVRNYIKDQIKYCLKNKKSEFLKKHKLPYLSDSFKIQEKWKKDFDLILNNISSTNKTELPLYKYSIAIDIDQNIIYSLTFYLEKLNSSKTSYISKKPINIKDLMDNYANHIPENLMEILEYMLIKSDDHLTLYQEDYLKKSFLIKLSEVENLFLIKHNRLTPTKILIKEPSINLTESENKSLTYQFKQRFVKNYYFENNNNKLELYIIDKKDPLNQALIQSVKIPKKETEKINTLALAVSGRYKIATRINIENAEELKNNSKITVLIEPDNKDFLINFLVDPLNNKDYQTAGKGDEVYYFNQQKIVRNFETEYKEVLKIINNSKLLQESKEDILSKMTFKISDYEVFLSLLSDLRELKDDIKLLLPDLDQFKFKKTISTKSLNLKVTAKSDLFSLDGTISFSPDVQYRIEQVLEYLDADNKYIKVDDDNYYFLTDKLSKYLKRIKQYSNKNKDGELDFNSKNVFILKNILENLNDVSVNKEWEEKVISINKTLKSKYKEASKEDFKVKLRDYQKDGIKWLSNLNSLGFGAILADDMGLGKTVQTLGFLITNQNKKETSIVIAPKSVSYNWYEETKKFCPKLKVLLIYEGNKEYDYKKYDLVILSYGLLKSQIPLMEKFKFNTLIIDESQYVKNIATQRFQNILKVNAKNKIALSGTPIENSISELWSIFRIINPGLLGTIKEFNSEYANPITRHNNTEKLGLLTDLIKPFILRRTKSEVLKELPAKTEKIIHIDFTEEEQIIYEAQKQKTLNKIGNIEKSKENSGSKHIKILAELSKLRQICCSPKLVIKNQEFNSSKLNEFNNIINNIVNSSDHKILVFSQFVKFLDLAREELDAKQINYCYLDGQTSLKKRGAQIETFQNDSDHKVFLISLKAGGSGLNLTAADYVLHLDPWWNPAVEDQATDRAHRMGQKKAVNVYKFIINNSIESQIIKLHKKKKDLANSIINNTSANSSKLNIKDLINLIS